MSVCPCTASLPLRLLMSHYERYPGDSAIRQTIATDASPAECAICLEALTTTSPARITYADSGSDPCGDNLHLAATIDRCGHVFGR